MNKESLNIVSDDFVSLLEKSNIDTKDKLELLINIRLFLENYDENIQLLKHHEKKRKY